MELLVENEHSNNQMIGINQKANNRNSTMCLTG